MEIIVLHEISQTSKDTNHNIVLRLLVLKKTAFMVFKIQNCFEVTMG